jgi:hypothetical protein
MIRINKDLRVIRTHPGLYWDDIAQDFPEYKNYKEAMIDMVKKMKRLGLIRDGKREG